MNPRIQYALTADGASVAFWSLGSGPPVIQMPLMPFTHIQLEWEDPDFNAWYTALLQRFRLIRYDTRGCGLSSAEGQTYSLETMVEDLRAVAGRAGVPRFGLLAPVQAGPAAIAFAARHPGRVSRLVLWMAVRHGSDMRTPRFEALRQLSVTDWGLFCEAAAHAIVAGWENAATAHRIARIMRESSSAAIHEALLRDYLEADISDLLPGVRCPVMVAHRMEGSVPPPSTARRLAASMRDASLAPFPGSSMLFLPQETAAIARAVSEFLDVEQEPARRPVPASGFCTLLYTDIEGHTSIIRRLGDERGRVVLREHQRITRQALAAHDGTEVRSTGDGFLARFATAQAALTCAAELQRELADASAGLPVELRVRVGINAGEPIAEGDELFGAAVVNAERIAAMAEGGQVLVANVVKELVAGKGFAFADRGEAALPGLDEPVRVWELRWAITAT